MHASYRPLATVVESAAYALTARQIKAPRKGEGLIEYYFAFVFIG